MAKNWGGLNNALAAWRNGLNALLPNRSTRSDGAKADGDHASTSQHQADSDGTVDAFDEDRNYLGSADQDGSAAEDRIHAALDADFMADPRAHLIISDRTIRNDQIGNWRSRPYDGPSPHTEHTHRQVHQSREDDGRPWDFARTRALLEEMNDMTPDQLLDALETPRGKAILRNAVTEKGYGPVDARESIAGRIANIDSKIDAVAEAVRKLVPPENPPAPTPR